MSAYLAHFSDGGGQQYAGTVSAAPASDMSVVPVELGWNHPIHVMASNLRLFAVGEPVEYGVDMGDGMEWGLAMIDEITDPPGAFVVIRFPGDVRTFAVPGLAVRKMDPAEQGTLHC